MAQAPQVKYSSTRRIGLELELAATATTEHRPPQYDPEHWLDKEDGSLDSKGREYILRSPTPHNVLFPILDKFCRAVQIARTNIGMKGGMHVHVATPEHTPREVAMISMLYRHFKGAIDKLIGPSRVDNSYCENKRYYSIEETITARKLANRNIPRRTSSASHDSVDRQVAVNDTLTRCRNGEERSVEFRQGSPSSSPTIIFGWVTLCVVFVEAVLVEEHYLTGLKHASTVAGLAKWVKLVTPLSKLDTWVKWRADYLHPPLSKLEEGLPTLLTALNQTGPAKLFTISRIMDVSHPHANALLNLGCQRGMVECIGGEYRVGQRLAAQRELAELEAFLPEN